MTDTLRIKRRTSPAGAPSALANAEIAFNEASGILYYGSGGTPAAAASIIAIGGSGAFLPLAGGTLTGALTVTAGGITVTGLGTFNTGISFGSQLGASTTDLSKHIALWGTTWGFGVTSGSINVVASGAAVAQFNSAGVYVLGNLTTTGTATFGSNTAAQVNYINGPAASTRQFIWQTAGSTRWVMQVDASAESGSNAGSNFYLQNFTDGGVFIGSPFAISRASGLVTIGSGLTVSAGGITAYTTGGTAVALTLSAGGSNSYLFAIPGISGGAYNPLTVTGDMALLFSTGSVGTGNLFIGPWTNSNTGIRMAAAAGTITFRGASTFGEAVTFSNGVSFGNTLGASNTDLSHHIALYSTTYGINVTTGPSQINYVVPAGAAHNFVLGTVTIANIGPNVTLLGAGTGAQTVAICGAAAFGRWLDWRSGTTSVRWRIATNATAESGSNAGSDWVFQRFDDTGASLGTPIQITRSTGNITLGETTSTLTLPGAVNVTGSLVIDGQAIVIGGEADEIPLNANLGTAAYADLNSHILANYAFTHNAAYQVLSTDWTNLLLMTTGTNTWTLPAASDVNTGWWAYFKNRATTNLTIALSGTDTLNGVAASQVIPGGSSGRLFKSGAGTFESIVIPGQSTTTPLMNGTAAIGTSLTYAAADHVHPSDTTRVAKAGDTMTGALNVQNAAVNITSTTTAFQQYQLRSTGNGTDQNIWDFTASTTQFVGRAVNDAYTAANNWVAVNRSGYTIASVYLYGTVVTPGGHQATNTLASTKTSLTGQLTFYDNTWGIQVSSVAGPRMGFIIPGTGAGVFTTASAIDMLQIDNVTGLQLFVLNAYKPSGGSWAATSDDRTKEDVEAYKAGLDEVLALKPIKFKYNGRGGTTKDGRTYHGLSAQATQPVMPELVHTRADSDIDDLLATELGPLTLALVNCVKQLTARVEELEKRTLH